MPFSVDTSLAFAFADGAAAEGAGYQLFNPSNLSWTGTGVRLTGTSAIIAAIRTPQIDTSGWQSINGVVPVQTEAVGYQHRFLVSFDDWGQFSTKFIRKLVGSTWQSVASSLDSEADIASAVSNGGMTINELANARLFAPLGLLTLFVGIARASGGGTGLINGFNIYYGAPEYLAYPGEGVATETLPHEPDRASVVPQRGQVIRGFDFEDGYTQVVERATSMRQIFRLAWSNIDADTADELEEFLNEHKEAPFRWTPQGRSAAKSFVVTGDVARTQVHYSTLWNIAAPVEETL